MRPPQTRTGLVNQTEPCPLAAEQINDSYAYTGVDGRIYEAVGYVDAGGLLYTNDAGVVVSAIGVRFVAADGSGDVAITDGLAALGMFDASGPYTDTAGVERSPMPIFETSIAYQDSAGVWRSPLIAVDFTAVPPPAYVPTYYFLGF